MSRQLPEPGDALIVVDVQRDFLPGGALAVPKGDEVIEPLNRYIDLFSREGLPIFATRDWHPPDHCSFDAQCGPWPAHCVRNTPGAEFGPLLHLPPEAEIVSKATDLQLEAYSEFSEPIFEERLRMLNVRRLWVGGLATDYCVKATIGDAIKRGYRVLLLGDAVCAVEVEPGDGERALDEMLRWGAVLVKWGGSGPQSGDPA